MSSEENDRQARRLDEITKSRRIRKPREESRQPSGRLQTTLSGDLVVRKANGEVVYVG